jgi:hypothetical protein
MSLLDVIRYPISDPPTLEELEALPKDIQHEWLTHHVANNAEVSTLAGAQAALELNWFWAEKNLREQEWDDTWCREQIRALRQLIRDYDSV